MPSPLAILEILVCSLISFLPYMLLIVYPFRRYLRFGNGLTVTLTIFAAIIQLVCDLAVGMALMPNTTPLLIATLVIHVLLSLVLIRMPSGGKLFAQLAIIGSAVILSAASKQLTQTLFPDDGSGMFRWIFLLMLIALQAVILVPLALMIVKKHIPQAEAIPVPDEKPAQSQEQPVLQPAAQEAPAPKEEVKSPIRQTMPQDHLTQLQSLQHDNLMLRITESDQFHRELRRHVDAMAYRLDRNQIDKLQLHIRALQEQLSGEDENTFCGNRELNNVLTYYNRMAGYCGTMVTTAMQMDEKPPVDVEDLTVLLGNLLDNALAACSNQTSRDRRIFTALRMNGSALYLTVENTYDTPVQKSASGRYLSTKHSGYGVGLEVCQQIAARHNGTLELNDFNGIFKATAILRP